ncbi:TRAP transporter large permease subunit [Miltoncostaea oceani]|uniref:TRAP transporter large permease n=1 Tax=Miltoncostaea oceani TaxID=2843216 RepID=UPI001C3D04F5|nr:TRAP transporter large permease subunit [Miltoncostaea oceani]
MTTTAHEPVGVPPPTTVAVLAGVERWLGVYSQAAVRIASVGAVISATIALLAVVGNVFTRQVLGFSIFGANELASFAFLWTIWMGVSLAVKRGAVTVITLLSHHGPALWQRSVRTFSALSLAVFLAYACYRSTEFALGRGAPAGVTSALEIPWFYPVVSMAVGFYFITLHYLHAVAGEARVAALRGRVGLYEAATGLAGGLVVGAAVWLALWTVLTLGAAPLVALGILFVALTLAGTPIVFMLAIVGIIAMFSPSFLGLTFYPTVDPITPFFQSQSTMGLSGGSELLVILMFLIVAEVMNASGLSTRLIAFAASLVAHLRGGMAYVCQLTSAVVSGISGSAQADAAIMTPLLVPAMEREGYRRDVAAAVVAGASIKGPIGPLSIMFIVYGIVVQGPAGASISALLLSGVVAELLLLIFQAATVYVVVRRMDFLVPRPFAGWRVVGRTGLDALPVLAIPVVILGGIFTGVFTPSESGAIAALVTIGLALFWYASLSPLQLPAVIIAAAVETGIVMLLLGDSSILAKALFINGFGTDVQEFLTGITDNKYVFLLVVNVLLLAVGIFIEPLPAVYILAPFLAPVAVLEYGIDPVHFGLIMVFNLVLALIHPPIGLVIFLVSSIAKVSVERLSVMILPWLAVSLLVLFLITYLPSEAVLVLSNLLE